MRVARAGTAAFAGGGLYLVISALAASESVQALGASMVESFREAVHSPKIYKEIGQFDLVATKKTGFGSVGVPVGDSNDDEWDWDNNKPY